MSSFTIYRVEVDGRAAERIDFHGRRPSSSYFAANKHSGSLRYVPLTDPVLRFAIDRAVMEIYGYPTKEQEQKP